MKRISTFLFACIFLLTSLCLLCACGKNADKPKVKVLIIPKFEIGEMSGDEAGEAQLFYENYCADCEEIDIPNSTPTSQFYFNDENGVGLLVTGSGKTAAGLSLMSLLSWRGRIRSCSGSKESISTRKWSKKTVRHWISSNPA